MYRSTLVSDFVNILVYLNEIIQLLGRFLKKIEIPKIKRLFRRPLRVDIL